MTIALRLLGEASHDGTSLAGARPARLLAALALHRGGASATTLVDEVWGDDPPAAPAKALQVLVSRLRAQAGPALIERYDGGYRLGREVTVDAWQLTELAEAARRALAAGDPGRALSLTAEALGLLRTLADGGEEGPLAELRSRARSVAARLDRTHGLALSRCGKDAEAVSVLEPVHRCDRDDAEVLVALLRSEAAATGAPVALARYEAYRRDLADRLGVDPDETLQRVHRELLAADEPVRSGVRFDADELLGREEDLARLRAMVRTGRLTSIIGPGGLGKTRIAHVLAREASEPRVHFVELVGIGSPDDVVSELGSALGVRHSVAHRRTLTPAQLADVRGRIAQELDSVPTLLVLDNCEHVLDAVASLVAFLLVTTRDLRVVTTSRAPLAIAAERVLMPSQLSLEDGMELFSRRALAARPGAELPEDVVADIVERLDGLPLALELAAARMRSMTAEEVRRRLDDRFALLRGRDRSAPARHQTLTAVIAWSWDLLTAEEQRALAWLSVFHDGFAVDGAAVLLGSADAPDLVEGLVHQSLLVVSERDGAVRYRMLETVREFGAQRLAEAGEVDAARDAQAAWAVALAEEVRPEVFGARQVDMIDLLLEEENNLTDVMRRRLLDGDVAPALVLLSVLGALWSITGNYARVFAFADLAQQVVVTWEPPPEAVEVTADALSLLLIHSGFMRADSTEDLARALARIGPPSSPWARVIYGIFVEAEGPDDRVDAALRLTDHPDLATALMAWQWAAVLAENLGEVDAALEYVDRALAAVDHTTTTWQVAMLHSQKSVLALQRGEHAVSAEHALRAVPMLERLHAEDDATQMRLSIAAGAIMTGDLATAERIVEESGRLPGSGTFGDMVAIAVGAELLLARGEVERGLAAYDASVDRMRAIRLPGVPPTGIEPWVIVAAGAALTAHVHHARTPAQHRRRGELAVEVLGMLRRVVTGDADFLDFPVAGIGLVGLGAHLLAGSGDPEAGVRLLALGRAFGYNRGFPVMAWPPLVELADEARPGRLAAVLEEYGDRPGRALVGETGEVLARVELTSSG